ncbi:MAG: ABC transporter substrate-binding protein [Armatimonadota bacterium]
MLERASRALLLVSLLLLGGCGGRPTVEPTPPSPSETFPLTVTDDEKRQVAIPAPPRRIVSLAAAHTETLFALGAGERVVAADSYSDYPPEAKHLARLRCFPRVPLEELVALRPDLVLILTQEDEEISQMEAAGLRVLKIFPETLDAAWDRILLLGRITEREQRAQEIVDDIRRRVTRVERSLQGVTPRTVMFELDASDPARPYVAGSGGFYGQLIPHAGGRNVFEDLRGPSGQVSAEQVIARSPEVILLGDTRSPVLPQSPELVRQRPGWGRISAVREGRVFGIDSDRITRPGPRLIEGLEEIARRLHPERFREAAR